MAKDNTQKKEIHKYRIDKDVSRQPSCDVCQYNIDDSKINIRSIHFDSDGAEYNNVIVCEDCILEMFALTMKHRIEDN